MVSNLYHVNVNVNHMAQCFTKTLFTVIHKKRTISMIRTFAFMREIKNENSIQNIWDYNTQNEHFKWHLPNIATDA